MSDLPVLYESDGRLAYITLNKKIFHSPKRSLKAKETCCEKYSTGSWFSHPCNANF